MICTFAFFFAASIMSMSTMRSPTPPPKSVSQFASSASSSFGPRFAPPPPGYINHVIVSHVGPEILRDPEAELRFAKHALQTKVEEMNELNDQFKALLIEKEKSLGDAVQQSLLSSFKGTSPDYNRALLAAVDKVTAADLERVAPVHLGRLFDTAQTRTTLVCGPSKLDEVTIHFDPLAILFNSKFIEGAERLQRNRN